eukprot:753227-Hanusia_phi.AAC.1
MTLIGSPLNQESLSRSLLSHVQEEPFKLISLRRKISSPSAVVSQDISEFHPNPTVEVRTNVYISRPFLALLQC